MTSYKKRWGYKGVETALNGLTGWLDDKLGMEGNADKRFDEGCSIIIAYAEKHIPRFKKKGHLRNAADFVAKKIDKNNKFTHFSQWVLMNYKQQTS